MDLLRPWSCFSDRPKLDDCLPNSDRHHVALVVPATAAFLKPTRPFSFVSLDPFIASLSTDLVVTAQLAEGVFVRQIGSDEHHFSIHRFQLSPGHGQILAKSTLLVKNCYLCA
ncbi:hypothetical protein D3C76_1276070 [compost metagenome]